MGLATRAGQAGDALAKFGFDPATPNGMLFKALSSFDELAGVERALALGADPLAQDGRGISALMLSAQRGGLSCFKRLLPLSDPLQADMMGSTALMWSVSFGAIDYARLLLPVSDVLARDKAGDTAADRARNRGYDELADLIEGYSQAAALRQELDAALPQAVRKPKPGL